MQGSDRQAAPGRAEMKRVVIRSMTFLSAPYTAMYLVTYMRAEYMEYGTICRASYANEREKTKQTRNALFTRE